MAGFVNRKYHFVINGKNDVPKLEICEKFQNLIDNSVEICYNWNRYKKLSHYTLTSGLGKILIKMEAFL